MSSQHSNICRSYEDERQYLNINLKGSLSLESENWPQLARAQRTYNQPIIDNPEKYSLSITRFDIDSSLIPVLFFRIEDGAAQNNVDLGVYQISVVSELGGNYTQNVIYNPNYTGTANLPQPPSLRPDNRQDLQNPYYYVYSYQHMVDMINSALFAAFAAYLADPVNVPLVSSPPLLQYIPEIGFQFVWEENWRSDLVAPPASQVALAVNRPLYDLLASLPWRTAISDIYNVDAYFLIFRKDPLNINFYTNPGGTYSPPYDAVVDDFFYTRNEFILFDYWNSLYKIVIISNTLPIVREYVPSQNVNTLGTNAVVVGEGVISDFVPPISDPGNVRERLIYNPTAEYRRIKMVGRTPLHTVDISIYWEDSEGVLRPLQLVRESLISVKLLFEKYH